MAKKEVKKDKKREVKIAVAKTKKKVNTKSFMEKIQSMKY